MIDLVRASRHVRVHAGKTFVVKVGGGAVARRQHRQNLARQLAVVHALGARVVLVHGGGPQTDELQRKLGEEPRMVGGRRVTTPLALRALRMATAGELHGELLGDLSAEGVPAVGVAGASAGLLLARRRPPVVTDEGPIDYGSVGDVMSVDPAPLSALLDAGRVPVVSPPAADARGELLNVNADLAAAHLAVGLGAAKLVLATGVAGILTDAANPASLVSSLALADLDELEREGSLREGMRVKAVAIRAALTGGVGRVHVVSGTDPEALLVELYTNHGAGTLVTLEREEAPPAELVEKA